MKNLIVITILGISTFGTAVPAFAGPDWQIIEQGRRTKIAQIEEKRLMKMQALQASGSSNAQQIDKDAQMDRMMQECAAMMKK